MEDGIGATRHPFDADLAAHRVEERRELGRPVADVLVGAVGGKSGGLPTPAGIGRGLERPGLILAPDRQPQRSPSRYASSISRFWGRRPGR